MNETEALTASERRRAFEQLIGATPETDKRLWSMLDRLIVQYLDERDEWVDERVEALARHFPSLRDVMLLVWEHHIVQPDATSPCTICPRTPAAS